MTPCANQLSGWEFFTALFMAGLFRFAAAITAFSAGGMRTLSAWRRLKPWFSSIVWMIVITGILTFVFQELKL